MTCPTWSGCEYALKDWAAAYHSQTYENKGALQVDNSDGPTQGGNLHYTHLIRAKGIPALWQHTRFPFIWDTFEIAWTEYILPYAHDGGYDYILSVEADIILPPDGMEKMVAAAQEHEEKTGKPSYVTQRYHPRGQSGPSFWWDTLGCSLFPVEPLYKDRHLVCSVYELEVFITLLRHGWVRCRPGTHGPDLFVPQHLRDPKDPVVVPWASTSADGAYQSRVFRFNGLNPDGSVPYRPPAVSQKEIKKEVA
jgi:hypothetical protein